MVLALWAGLSPQVTARLLGMGMPTLRQRVQEIGARLPGTLPAQHKILLWKADVQARQP